MERDEIKEYVISKIKMMINADNESIDEDSYLVEDLDIESLEVFELMANVEDEYNIVIPEFAVKQFVQVKDIIDYLSQLEKTSTSVGGE